MSVMDITVAIDGEPYIVSQSEDQPKELLIEVARAFMVLLAAGITEDTDLTPLP